MRYRSWRSALALIFLLLSAAVFVYYFRHQPAVRHQLTQISWPILLGLLGLYIVSVLALTLLIQATVLLSGVHVKRGESLRLTAYSSVINFFGPLQSGPAFRALYLKRRHQLSLRRYSTATATYYGLYAVFNGLFLLTYVLGPIGFVAILVFLILAYTFVGRSRLAARRLGRVSFAELERLAIATLLQVSIYVVIYYIELHTIAPATTFRQAIIYTGVANLALFVSLTPGAIGFRESFLLFSQHLHHVDNATIVAANLIDRAVYVVLLAVIATVIFGTHAQRELVAATGPLREIRPQRQQQRQSNND